MNKASAKAATIQQYKKSSTDTGSSEVQIALLTSRISDLSNHCKWNKKDYSTSRSMIKMVGQRKRLLKYLQRKSHDSYKAIIESLGLRK